MPPLENMPQSPAQPAPAPVTRRSVESPRVDDMFDLATVLGALYEGRWLILATTLLVGFSGLMYAFLWTPVLKADALVQVEEKKATMGGMKELSEMFADSSQTDAEISLIRSRAVVAQVVDDLHLDIIVTPRFFPIFGHALFRRYDSNELASPALGLDSFAWGGERLVVSKLSVPPALEEEALTLIAGEAGAFKLYGPDDELLLSGRAGEVARQEGVRLGQRAVEILVAELVARPDTKFFLRKDPAAVAIADFLEKLTVTEVGKSTGIILIELVAHDGELVRTALDAVATQYVRQNIQRKAEEAEKTLDFIVAQLPAQKLALEAAEVKLNEYRKKTGKLQLSIEAQSIVTRSTDVARAVTEYELQKFELRRRYTPEHPVIVALDQKIAQLSRSRRLLETEAKALPETEMNSVRLVRDTTVANDLYVLMLNKAQELNLVKSGTIGNVRVVDRAMVQPKPVSPKKPLAVAASLVLGLVLGAGLAFIRKSHQGVDDPDALERALGLPVYASIPFSDKQNAMANSARRGRAKLQPLARLDAADLAMESLRSLRTSLEFSLASARNNVILIGGSRPGVGKSFVSVNLAHVLVDAGKRVLLIDGDIRKGRLHCYFDQKRGSGLSEMIGGAKEAETLIRETGVPFLHFLSSGAIPPNPSELLASDRFTAALAKLSAKYDLVLVDGPPVLAVTDAALLSRAAGVNLLVVKFGIHSLPEIALAVSRLQQGGAMPTGFVFNAIPLKDRMYGFGKHRYRYQYDYRSSKEDASGQ